MGPGTKSSRNRRNLPRFAVFHWGEFCTLGDSREFMMRSMALFGFSLLLGLMGIPSPCRAEGYDPLAAVISSPVQRFDTEFTDSARNRVIPIRIYQCEGVKSAPVVLFSHGLGGSRSGSVFLGEHWAKRGYVAIFVQHPGSDEGVWKNQRLGQRMEAMREAASGSNLLLRVQDISAVIDQLEKWAADSRHSLHGVVDLKKIGMSGHSFGAQTTQMVSGQTMLRAGLGTDPRIRAALPMSPNTPAVGDPVRAFSQVKIPWLLMTGTQDVSAIGGATVESRRAVFPALPAGNKYELVLDQAEHSVFTDRPLPGDKTGRNPNHHRVILALSTAFWDAYLKEDPAARKWLDGEGPRGVLESADLWQKK